ncbi:unnamed protein product [Effrenium voratum]|nr:unnamed protein product [Effrenium voratum]
MEGLSMAALSAPPFNFETEVLVKGSLEISAEKLASGLSWLAAAVKEQNRVLGTISRQVDELQAGAASTSPPPSTEGNGRLSIKEEMITMQMNAIKHEVSSLPRPGDLERQRERLMVEVQTISSTLSDRQRESHEHLQKELADVTDNLCTQLGRIGDDVSARLLVLESHFERRPSAGLGASTAAGLGEALPPLPNPTSASSIGAEDTEDVAADAVGSDALRHAANFQAELASLDARVNSRIEAVERQVRELDVKASAASVGASGAVGEAKLSEAQSGPSAPSGPSGPSGPSSPPAPSAGPGAAGTGADGLADAQAEGARVVGSGMDAKLEGLDGTAILAAASEAAREAAKAAVSEVSREAEGAAAKAAAQALAAVADGREQDRSAIAALQQSLADLSEKIRSLQMRKRSGEANPSSTPGDPADTSFLTSEHEEPSSTKETIESCDETLETQSTLLPANLTAEFGTVKDRLIAVELCCRNVTEEVPALKSAVPHLEQQILRLQQSMAELSSEIKECRSQSEPRAVQGAEGESHEPKKGDQSPSPEPQDEPSEELSKLASRLQEMEELQGNAERRLQKLEEPREVRRNSEERRTVSNREGWTSSKSEPPAGGTVGGSWKDVQAELEHFRKLFEFIEGVLPRDAAEAMRFFNRRNPGKEEMSEMVSSIFGADVEFQNAKSQLETEFKMHTRELRREFDKLTLAMKGLQRDLDGSGGKIIDLAKRTSQLESEVRTGAAVSMEDSHQERDPASGDGKDRDGALQGFTEELQKAVQDLREEVKRWLEMFKSSVVQALQTKPDLEQVAEIIKQVAAAPAGESIALFAKRQLLGKCASCESPIDADLMRIKRPQAIGLQEHWPPGDSLGAKVSIRPLNPPLSPSSSSLSRLPKIGDRHREPKKLKPSASTPEMRKEETSLPDTSTNA